MLAVQKVGRGDLPTEGALRVAGAHQRGVLILWRHLEQTPGKCRRAGALSWMRAALVNVPNALKTGLAAPGTRQAQLLHGPLQFCLLGGGGGRGQQAPAQQQIYGGHDEHR